MLDFGSRESALELEPDVIRLFGAGDVGVQGMIAGWSGPEIGHNWNDGIDVIFAIATALPVARLRLAVGGEPYVSRVRAMQEMTLHGNGFYIGFKRMTSRVEYEISIPLEPEWWFPRGKLARMVLRFHLPHSVRPMDISDGPDGRELGFCFRSICLRTMPD